MKKEVIQYITQVILIVFSVVLGLFLSERIEDRKNDKEAQKLLSKIASEVNDNRQLIEEWAPYHKAIANSLDSLSKSEQFVEAFIQDKSALFDAVLTKGTFMGRMPSSDAWDIAKSHPLIVNFDYEDLLILSKVYNQQRGTFLPSAEISDLFFSPNFNDKELAQSNLEMFNSRMQEVVSREQQLLFYYREAATILSQ